MNQKTPKPKVDLKAQANRINLRQRVSQLTPQSRKIAQHLLENNSITAVEAAAIYKTRSLTRRIADIRDLLVDIASVRKTDATGQRYVRYVLA